MNISNTRKDRGNESVPPFTIMQHEIIVSVYDMGYGFSLMIDNITPPDGHTLKNVWFSTDYITFIKFFAVHNDWNAGDLVRLVWCEDGGIETALVRVNNENK
jgi:hypothetical protein